MKISAREVRSLLIEGLLVILILFVYATYVIKPLMRDAMSLGPQVQEASQELARLEAAVKNETTLKAQYQQVGGSVASLRKRLPSEEEVSSVIEFLSDLASQTNVKVQAIFPQRAALSESLEALRDPTKSKTPSVRVYKEIPIEIDALAGYHQLGTFLSLVETGNRPMQLGSLRISQNSRESKRHNVRLLFRSYFAASEPGQL